MTQPVTRESLENVFTHLTNAIVILQHTPVPKKGIVVGKSKVPKGLVIKTTNDTLQFLTNMAQEIQKEIEEMKNAPANPQSEDTTTPAT